MPSTGAIRVEGEHSVLSSRRCARPGDIHPDPLSYGIASTFLPLRTPKNDPCGLLLPEIRELSCERKPRPPRAQTALGEKLKKASYSTLHPHAAKLL